MSTETKEIKISDDIVTRLALVAVERQVKVLLETYSGRMFLSVELGQYLKTVPACKEIGTNLQLIFGNSENGCKTDFDKLMNKFTNQSTTDRARSIRIVAESIMQCILFIYAPEFIAIWKKMMRP